MTVSNSENKVSEQKCQEVKGLKEPNFEVSDTLTLLTPKKGVSEKRPAYEKLLKTIKVLYERKKEPLSIVDLQRMNPHCDEAFFEKAKRQGDLFEKQPGKVMPL